MRKFQRAIALVLALCMLALLLCACGASSKFVGSWVCEEVRGGYPDQMSFASDGTGTADGLPCNWAAENGELKLSIALLGSDSYSYEFSGGKLYLDGYGYTKQ